MHARSIAHVKLADVAEPPPVAADRFGLSLGLSVGQGAGSMVPSSMMLTSFASSPLSKHLRRPSGMLPASLAARLSDVAGSTFGGVAGGLPSNQLGVPGSAAPDDAAAAAAAPRLL